MYTVARDTCVYNNTHRIPYDVNESKFSICVSISRFMCVWLFLALSISQSHHLFHFSPFVIIFLQRFGDSDEKKNKNRLFNALLIVELPMNSLGYWEFHRNQHANDKQPIFNMTRIHLHARNKREFGPSVCINRQNDNCISIFDFDYLFL